MTKLVTKTRLFYFLKFSEKQVKLGFSVELNHAGEVVFSYG